MKGAFCDYNQGFGVNGDGMRRNGNNSNLKAPKCFKNGTKKYLCRRVAVDGTVLTIFFYFSLFLNNFQKRINKF